MKTSGTHRPASLPPGRPAVLASDLAVCVWIPLFPLRAEERRRPDLVGRPVAILSPTDTRKVSHVSSIARHAGVITGMTVSQSIGLCPTLTLLEADPVYYDEQFSTILAALEDISPVVEPAELGRVYVGVDGLERLLGTPERQLGVIGRTVGRAGRPLVERSDRVQSGSSSDTHRKRKWRRPRHRPHGSPDHPMIGSPVSPTDYPVRLGWGRGKFTAWVAARHAKPGQPVIVDDADRLSFLERQSVSALPIETDTLRRLWRLGIKTLGMLAALPEEAVTTQFGREGKTAWRLACGKQIEPVHGSEKPEPIIAAIDFPVPFADHQLLGHAIERLLDRALRHPRRIGWRVHVMRARAAIEHGSSWLAEVTLREPSARREHLAAPLRTKLEQSPPSGGVDRLAIEFVEFVRGTTELQLFARDAAAAARAGRQRALRWAAQEIKTRFKRPLLHHVIAVHPASRLPERRYALIDYEG